MEIRVQFGLFAGGLSSSIGGGEDGEIDDDEPNAGMEVAAECLSIFSLSFLFI